VKSIEKNIEKFVYNYLEEQLHFLWAFALTIVGYQVWHPLLILGLAATLGKEVWDHYRPPHRFEWQDIVWGSFGWIAALFCL